MITIYQFFPLGFVVLFVGYLFYITIHREFLRLEARSWPIRPYSKLYVNIFLVPVEIFLWQILTLFFHSLCVNNCALSCFCRTRHKDKTPFNYRYNNDNHRHCPTVDITPKGPPSTSSKKSPRNWRFYRHFSEAKRSAAFKDRSSRGPTRPTALWLKCVAQATRVQHWYETMALEFKIAYTETVPTLATIGNK